MTHGSGGRAMAQLIEELFVERLDNELLRQANDQAAFDVAAGRLVMSTDGHVISPLFFPGGDIGSLAVHGTTNDLAVAGARPMYLTLNAFIEEGFEVETLERIVTSLAEAAVEAGLATVPHVVAGERCIDRWKVWHELAIDRYLARRTQRIVTNSSGVRDFYVDHGLPAERDLGAAVVAAGSSDAGVAREAMRTLAFAGVAAPRPPVSVRKAMMSSTPSPERTLAEMTGRPCRALRASASMPSTSTPT